MSAASWWRRRRAEPTKEDPATQRLRADLARALARCAELEAELRSRGWRPPAEEETRLSDRALSAALLSEIATLAPAGPPSSEPTPVDETRPVLAAVAAWDPLPTDRDVRRALAEIADSAEVELTEAGGAPCPGCECGVHPADDWVRDGAGRLWHRLCKPTTRGGRT